MDNERRSDVGTSASECSRRRLFQQRDHYLTITRVDNSRQGSCAFRASKRITFEATGIDFGDYGAEKV
jgi:hypothetical protein